MILRFIIRFHSTKQKIIPTARPVVLPVPGTGFPSLSIMPHTWCSQGMLSHGVGISYSDGFLCSRTVGRHSESSYNSSSGSLHLPPSSLLTPNSSGLVTCPGTGLSHTWRQKGLASFKQRGLHMNRVTEHFCRNSVSMWWLFHHARSLAFYILCGYVEFPLSYCLVHTIGSKWLIEKRFKIHVLHQKEEKTKNLRAFG